MALNELGDGVTLSWHQPASQLSGRIKVAGICRQVIYALTRVRPGEQDDRWMIAG